MASKKKLKEFKVERRYTIWTETSILAENFDEAVTKAKDLDARDFLGEQPGLLDWSILPGLGVREVF